MRRLKNRKFSHFGVIFGSVCGPWSHLKKVQKSPQIQIANISELISMGNTLEVKYKFGAWQIL